MPRWWISTGWGSPAKRLTTGFPLTRRTVGPGDGAAGKARVRPATARDGSVPPLTPVPAATPAGRCRRARVQWQSTDAGWSSSVARWAHNPEVTGSNPVPATTWNGPHSRTVRAVLIRRRRHRSGDSARSGRRAEASVPGSSRRSSGSTRPAPDGRSPYRPADPAPRPRTGGRHLGARPRRPRGRGRRPARPGDRLGAHEVPGRRAGAREERARVRADEASSQSHRAEQLKRLDGIATILAKTAVRDSGLLALLAEDAVVSDAARSLTREMLRAAGVEPPPEEAAAAPSPRPRPPSPSAGSCRSRWSPGSWPTPSSPPTSPPPAQRTARPRRLAGWELLGPLLNSFERAGGGAPACMALPAPDGPRSRPMGRELMPHQGQLVAAAAAGPPDLPARRRARPGQDGPGAARRGGGERLPAAGGRAERRQDQLGARGRPAGRRTARPPSSRATARRSTASPTSSSSTTRCSTATWAGSATSASAAWSSTRRTSSRTRPRSARSTSCELSERIRSAHRAPAADGAHRHPADQRHRGLPGHLAVPRLDRRQQAARRADGRPRGRPA